MIKSCLILLFAIGIIFSLSLKPIYAAASPLPSSNPTPTSVDYSLPYPGILPDSPLYILKAIRDRVVSFFISDPLKKAEFDLLMADVRLNAAQYLFDKGEAKYSLAETTISKGENYFFEALNMANVAKQQGAPVNDFISKLILASQKHQEVINQLELKTTGDLKSRMALDEKRSQDYEKQAKSISLSQ